MGSLKIKAYLALGASILLLLTGCGSSPYMLPESDTNSTAPGAAFTGDGMLFRKAMPDHRNFQRWEFYYKHCSGTGDEGYRSMTAYQCSDPF